jgi:flotillin
VLRRKLQLWREAGPDAESLFLIQMLPEIMRELVSTVRNLKIDKITVVDSGQGDGGGVPAVFKQIAGSTPALLESLKASTGIDVAGMLSRVGADKERPESEE